ncbi:hypothetical protein C8R44DRAFT_991137 [Mycena epipterygia]|nr:hypothetical protein C8R44DRAFT_991137 [Mycena epipterygia]
MHPALRLENLSQLPISYRRYASGAVNGSLEDLKKLVALVAKKRTANPELFLPVAFTNLDLNMIPEQLESVAQYAAPIQRAVLSLQILHSCGPFDIPGSFCVEMWPRIVKWIIFLDAYRDIIRHVIPLTENDRHNLYMELIMEYQNRRGTAALPNGTPDGIKEPGFYHVVRFLYNDPTHHPQHFQEYSEAAGGTRDDFAVLVKDHLGSTYPDGSDGYLLCETTVFSLTGLMRLLVECKGDDALTAALLSNGIVPIIADIIRAYAMATPVDGAEDLLSKCFTILVHKADDPQSHRWIAEALESDVLIVGIVSCAKRAIPGMQDFLRHLLSTILPRCLVYHSVVSMFDRTVDWKDAEATVFHSVPPFPDLALFALWEQFNKSATRFVRVFQAHDEDYRSRLRACDNMKCGRLCQPSEIKRCSACHQAYYCSPECQGIDWHADGHNEFCARLRAQRFNDPDHLTAREKSFMHALAGYRYNTYINDMAAQQMIFIHHNPGEPFYTLVDYNRGDPTVAVRAVRDYAPPSGAVESDAVWADQVSRAARSGGRMDLLIMAVAEGTRTRYRMESVRASTSTYHEGRKQIATEIPPGAHGPELEQALRDKAAQLFAARRGNGDQFTAWTSFSDS